MLIHLTLTLLMLLVIYFDATRYIIPNWLVGILLAVYPLFVFIAPEPVDWVTSLIIALIAFGVGFALFFFKVMGGGDVKLLAVCCLWVGKSMAAHFILYTAFLGGVMAVLILLGRPVAGFYAARFAPDRILPKILLPGEPLPYGIAIAIAFLILLWMEKLPALAL